MQLQTEKCWLIVINLGVNYKDTFTNIEKRKKKHLNFPFKGRSTCNFVNRKIGLPLMDPTKGKRVRMYICQWRESSIFACLLQTCKCGEQQCALIPILSASLLTQHAFSFSARWKALSGFHSCHRFESRASTERFRLSKSRDERVAVVVLRRHRDCG